MQGEGPADAVGGRTLAHLDRLFLARSQHGICPDPQVNTTGGHGQRTGGANRRTGQQCKSHQKSPGGGPSCHCHLILSKPYGQALSKNMCIPLATRLGKKVWPASGSWRAWRLSETRPWNLALNEGLAKPRRSPAELLQVFHRLWWPILGHGNRRQDRCPTWLVYSWRSATIGSTLIARLAGT